MSLPGFHTTEIKTSVLGSFITIPFSMAVLVSKTKLATTIRKDYFFPINKIYIVKVFFNVFYSLVKKTIL